MSTRLKSLQNKLEALIKEGTELKANSTVLNDEQRARYAEIPDQIDATRDEIQKEKALSDRFDAALAEGDKFLNGNRAELASVASVVKYDEDKNSFAELKKVRGRARFFEQVADRNGFSKAEARKQAYAFGMFLAATVLPASDPLRARASKWCRDHGIGIMAVAHSETDSERGAALVTPEFENVMIDLKEMFGIFRQFARYTPMTSDTKSRPRRRGGLVAYHVGSSQAAAESNAKWDRVLLVAKKIMVLAKYESELGEDAISDFGDILAGEMAYACAYREDQDGFNGDGTSDYGGIVGVRAKLLNTYGTGGGLGLKLGTGNNWNELTLGDHQGVKALVPQYAEEMGDIAWYCSKPYFEGVMAPIALAAGGVTAAEIVAGVRRQFLGYPVRITQAMPASEANSQVPVFLGALELAADFGDRRSTAIAFSEHDAFTSDEIVARCTERFDINVHDAGDSVAAGPVVGLLTRSS